MSHRRIPILFLMLLAATLPSATSSGSQPPSCDAFDSWIWAQTAYEANPDQLGHLIPEESEIACPDLPDTGLAPVLWADEIPNHAEPAQLDAIIDGDTFYAIVGGSRESVRMYHIDSPERGRSSEQSQCGAEEATRYLGSIFGQAPEGHVYLEYDVTERDQYDRRLAYVWFERNGQTYLINEAMVRSGWAASRTFEPDDRYKSELDAAEAFSVEHNLGMHDLCSEFPPPPEPTAPPDTSIAPPASDGDCDPAYPGVCILPIGQVDDLDCGDITERRFEVLPPDPHNFDGDRDGVGCEGG